MSVTITRLPGAEVEIVGEISADDFGHYRTAALKILNQEIKLDGFRPGSIPEKILIEKVGEERLLHEMAELALQERYPKIIAEEKIDAIGRPEITLTKLAKDNPLGFKIKTAVYPDLKLPDYQSLAKKVNQEPIAATTVEDQEVETVITELRKARTEKDKPEPELNDDFAKSLGRFTNLADLKNKIKENLKLEKESKEKDKRRLKIIETISRETSLELPEILIQSEIDKMVAEMRGQTEQMGLKFEDYLSHLKKTEADLRQDWRADAERRVKTALVLGKIAEAEKIGAPEMEVAAEVKHLKEHYPDATEDRLRAYVGNILINEYVFRFLENLK